MGTKTQKLSNVVDQIVEWQSVFTGDGSTGLTAVAGRGYFIDTTSGTVTVTLPASPKVGDIVQLKDYARTWGTNAVSIASATFDGVAAQTPSFSTNGQTVTLVYMDNTKGWSLINEDTTTGLGALFITATGGTVTTSGNYKIHSFTGDGCFVVSQIGNCSGGGDAVDYLVVAGGGGGGKAGSSKGGGGGGAGGLRVSSGTSTGCWTASPLGACVSAISVTSTTYPITVGAGGATLVENPGDQNVKGNPGSNSVFSTITSTGGGGGGSANVTGGTEPTYTPGVNGGSGGGGAYECTGTPHAGGSGNTPPVSPPQGNNGGRSTEGPRGSQFNRNAGGGGGAGGQGYYGGTDSPPIGSGPGIGPGSWPTNYGGGDGGAGVTVGISGSCTAYAGGGGGGGGGGYPGGAPWPEAAHTGAGGTGGGGAAGTVPASNGSAGTSNTGGGGGGGTAPGSEIGDGGAGGKGIVIIRYKYQ